MNNIFFTFNRGACIHSNISFSKQVTVTYKLCLFTFHEILQKLNLKACNNSGRRYLPQVVVQTVSRNC